MSLAEKGVLNLLSDDQLMDLAKTFLRTSAGVEATAEATAEASSKEREGLFALVSQPKLWNRISAAMPKENTGFKAALLFGAKPSSKSLMSLVKEFNELYPELHPTLPPEFQDYLFPY